MPKESIIKHYSSSTTGSVPSAVDLVEGELAINTADEKVFFKNLGGSVVDLASSKAISGAYAAKALPNTFTANQSFSAGLTAANGVTFTGPFTLLNGDTIYQTSGAFAGSYYSLYRKSRGTPSSPGTVVQGDAVGGFQFGGWDGSAWRYGSAIQGFVDGAVSSGTVPVNLRFLTSGSVRMIISSTGDVGIGTTTPTNRLTVSGNASISGSLTAATMFASNIVNSFNSLTGAVSYSPAIASASVTGVASFNSSFFSVSGSGQVSLTSPYSVIGVTGIGITGQPALTGHVTLLAGTNITVTNPSPGVIRISNPYVAPEPPTVGNGTLTLNVSGTGLTSGIQTFTANQSGDTTFTVTSNATSANTANAIVSRDGNGDFTGRYIYADYFNHSHASDYRGGDTVFYSSNDYFIRKNTKEGFLASLGLTNTASANTAGAIVLRDGSGNFSAGTATLNALTVDTNTLHVDAANDRVGIGTTTPGAKLDINGTTRFRDHAQVDAGKSLYFGYEELVGGSDVGGMDYGYIVWDNDNNTYARNSSSTENGCLRLGTQNDGQGSVEDNLAIEPMADLYLNPGGDVIWGNASTIRLLMRKSDGNVGIGTSAPGYKLEVNGSFAATTKSFVIDHPIESGKKLQHGSLEGPENGVYVRGRAHGRTVDLPHYWTGLVDESTITVQVTPFGRSQNLYVESVSIHQVVIGGDENPSYFYTVYGERKDVPKLKVEV